MLSKANSNLIFFSFLLVVILLFTRSVSASMMSVSFSDPLVDWERSGSPDLTGMDLIFDNSTGDYTLFCTASSSNPFVGDFNFRSILYNPDTGSTNSSQSSFQSGVRSYNINNPTTTLAIRGNDPSLTYWNLSNRVATDSYPFGNPTSPYTTIHYFSSYVNVGEYPSTGPSPLDRMESQVDSIREWHMVQTRDDLPSGAVGDEAWLTLQQDLGGLLGHGVNFLSLFISGFPVMTISTDILDWVPSPYVNEFPQSTTFSNISAITLDDETYYSFQAQSAPVPEPSTMLLLGAGLVGLVGVKRKLKK